MFLINKLISLVSSLGISDKPPKTKDAEAAKNSNENTEHKNTYYEGLIHMFRATVGTGILSLPVAFSQSGYILGVIGVIFVTYMSYYCANILASSQRELARRNKEVVPTYLGTVEAAFEEGPKKLKPFAPIFVKSTNFFMIIGQIGGVCVYLIFIASNIQAAVGPRLDWSLRLWTVVLSFPILALNMVGNLKKLAVISSLGNIILLSSVSVVFYYIFREPISLDGVRPFGMFRDLPQFFGSVFFASGYIGMILPLQCEMAKPEQLGGRLGVLKTNAIITGGLYVVFGFLGYVKYGDSAQGSVTLNLPSEEVLSKGVQVMLALSVMTATALQNYVTVSIVWDDYINKRLTKNRVLAQYLLRATIVLVTLLITLLIPDLELLVSVTGILGQVTLCSFLPCLIHLLTFFEQSSVWGYIRTFWMDVVICVFSIFILVTSINSLVFEVKNHFKV